MKERIYGYFTKGETEGRSEERRVGKECTG